MRRQSDMGRTVWMATDMVAWHGSEDSTGDSKKPRTRAAARERKVS